MKRISFSIGLVVLVFEIAMLAQTQTESVEQELIKLENEWADAVVKKDVAFLDRILADDYLATDPEGNGYTKAQEIASMKSEVYLVTSCVHHEMKVRVYGNAAVVTGRSTLNETYKGKDYSIQSRWTDTWVKLNGRWQCVAEHSSEIAQK